MAGKNGWQANRLASRLHLGADAPERNTSSAVNNSENCILHRDFRQRPFRMHGE